MLANEPLNERYELRPDVVATVLEDGAVLLDLETKYFYRLNRTGWAIVQLFELGTTMDEVWAHCRSLGAPSADDAAVTALITELSRDNLIEMSRVPNGGLPIPDTTDQPWSTPTIERQAEPLQRVIISAFDPSVPLVE